MSGPTKKSRAGFRGRPQAVLVLTLAGLLFLAASPRPAPAGDDTALVGGGFLTRLFVGNRGSTVEVKDGVWTVNWYEGSYHLRIKAKGNVEFNHPETDILNISRDGRFEVEEKDENGTRRLLVTGANGGVTKAWHVDGRLREFDEVAAAWFARILPEFFRRTGFGVDVRTERILDGAGVGGVLEEIALIPNDHVKQMYYSHLLSRDDLDSTDNRAIIEHVRTQISSDFEMSQLVRRLSRQAALDPEALEALARATAGIESDFEKRRALSGILERPDPDPGLILPVLQEARDIGSDFEQAQILKQVVGVSSLDAETTPVFVENLGTISSDSELSGVLVQTVTRGDLPVESRAALLTASLSIGSDFEQAKFLRAFTAVYPVEGPVTEPFFEATRTIGSDFELGRALGALLEQDEIHRRTLRFAIEDAGERIGSDHELAKFLVQVATAYPLDDDLREAYLSATDSIESDHENNRALAALARNQ